MRAAPGVVSRILRDSLSVRLGSEDHRQANGSDNDEVANAAQILARRLGLIIMAICKSARDQELSVRNGIAVDFVIVAHHPELSGDAQVSWVGLLQVMGLDAASVAQDQADLILQAVWNAADILPRVSL